MKAVICTKYGPPEVLQMKEIPKPEPKANEVCIKIKATAITGSDIIIRGCKVPGLMGIMMRIAIGFSKPRSPILGLVLAGEVESIGGAVKKYRIGDQIFGLTIKSPMQPRMGTYAQYKCLPEDSFIVKKPSNATFEESAAVPFGGGIALHFINRVGIQKGQRVLVYGASGSIGTSLVQLAKYYGAIVTGICSTSNISLVASLGVDFVIDYKREDFTTREDFYDVIFDAVPAGMMDRKALKLKCMQKLNKGGKYLSIDDDRPSFSEEGLLLLRELVETSKLKSVIDRTYPLEAISEAHRYVEIGHKKGNVIIRVD